MFEPLDPPKPLKAQNGGHFITAQANYYPHFVRVFIPKGTVLKGHTNPDITLAELISNPKIFDETPVERSIRRTRKNIKDILLCNEFEHFVTLTIATDRQNIQHSKAKVTNWVKNEKKRKGKFQHLIVPEFHKDGQSLHFHGVFLGYKGLVQQSMRDDGRPIVQKGRQVYQFPSYTSGFSNVKLIDTLRDSSTKVAFYLQKYVAKDMPILFGQNRYWASHGLKRPNKEDNPQEWYKAVKPNRQYENEFGIVMEFDEGNSPVVDMFIEANRP